MKAAIALAAIALAAGSASSTSHRPRCFGAASRDPAHRCVNPRLKRTVVPRPRNAVLAPVLGAPCTPIAGPEGACQFGVAPAQALRTVALLGDSHAEMWGAALQVVAQRLRWTVIDLIRSSCAFTLGTPIRVDTGRKDTACMAGNRAIIAWLDQHPEISAVVMSDHPGPVVRQPGQSEMDAWVAGIRQAWDALPASVAKIVAIRDVPFTSVHQLSCVDRAIRRHEDAGARCAAPRPRALHHDPDVVAAHRARSPRIGVVDLTHFFCSLRVCYPVVGGALVFRDDSSHITQVFAQTLGPYLLQRLEPQIDR